MAAKDLGFDKQPKKNFIRCNEQIRISQVLVIKDGENLGVMSPRDALAIARSDDLDLVEVAPLAKTPVCHIMDYGKFMYDKQKKEKHKSNAPKEKQVDFRYVISDHDLEVKSNQIKKFLSKGIKVKCVVTFKNREKAHKPLGFDLLNKLIDLLKDEAVPEKPPAFEGNNISVRLDKK